MEYLDFEIEIGLGKGRNFPVRVLDSPAGEREGSMHFPFDELELELANTLVHPTGGWSDQSPPPATTER